MADFKIKVSAETKDAEKQLQQVDKTATESTKPRSIKVEFPSYKDLTSNFRTLKNDIDAAANSIQQFYRISSKLPVGPVKEFNELKDNVVKTTQAANEASKSFGDAGAVIQGALGTAQKSANNLLNTLVRVGIALYAVQAAANAVNSAFSGFFKNTIGREAQLRETILKTQTTLASTSKVFKGGREITDPYEKITTLTGEVRKNIDSIRERSIALAGVTSNEVIEVFGIVAAQVGQIGGGLKEAEDLAINFAAALGTFGIPLYQARQEIGSILRGDITMDSYLAKSLGITNEDIAKAKSQAGGVVKFLEDRLSAAVAGQRIAAMGLAGVVSNIRDISELVGQNFGAGLLDPLIGGLTEVFDWLYSIKDQLIGLSRLAGKSIGDLVSTSLGRITENSALTPKRQNISEGLFDGAEDTFKRFNAMFTGAMDTVSKSIAGIIDNLAPALSAIVQGLTRLAEGLLSLKLEQFKALIGVANGVAAAIKYVSYTLSALLSAWGAFLELPLVQQFTQITAGMRLLQITGIMPLIKNGVILYGVIQNWGKISAFVATQFGLIKSMIAGLIGGLGTLIAQAARAGLAFVNAWQPANRGLQALRAEILATSQELQKLGTNLQFVGGKLGGVGQQTERVKGGLIGLAVGFLKFQLIMLAISAVLSIIGERFGAYQEQQNKIASERRAQDALLRLKYVYNDIGDAADEATKRAKQFEESLVDAQYDKAVQELEKVRAKMAEISDLRGNQDPLKDINPIRDFRSIAMVLNPANFGAFTDMFKPENANKSFGDLVYQRLQARERQAAEDLEKWKREINLKSLQDNIKIEANNRVNLEKEIAEYKRQVENELFQQRQQLAQKEVEIFRAAGELRIYQMEQANAKLIEGEEGASQAALEALNQYLSTRERGELDIESAKKEMQIEVANLEKSIVDYKYEQEKRIAELRKKMGDYETKVAQYRLQQAALEGKARQEGTTPTAGITGDTGLKQGNTGTSSTGPHFHVDGAATEAAARAIFANASKLVTTDRPGSSRDGGRRRHDGYDLAGPAGTPLVLAPGYTLQNFTRDPNSKGGNFADIKGPRGEMYVVRHLADPGPKWGTPQGGGNDFATRYLMRLSNLEGGYGINGSAARNRSTNARGYFQLIPDSEKWLRDSGKGQIADGMLSSDFATAAKAAYQFAILSRPAAKELFKQGDTAGLDRLLNRTWTSLPGGKEEATGARLQAGNALLQKGARNVTNANLLAPQAPSLDDAGGDVGGIARYTEAVRNLESTMQRLRALQTALTEAKTKTAFEQISKAMFPQVQLEQYKDQITETQVSLEAMRNVTGGGVFDPEALQIEIDYQSQIAIKNREIDEMLKQANEQKRANNLKDEELKQLQEDINKRKEKYLEDLKEEKRLKSESLQLTRQEQAILQLKKDTAAIPFNTQREALQMQANFARNFYEGDPVRMRLIEAEVRIMEKRIQLEQDGTKTTAEINRELAAFAEATRSSAVALGNMEKSLGDQGQRLGMAKEMGRTFSDGIKGFISSVMKGEDPSEALSNAMTSIADKFVGMMLDYAFAPVEKMFEDIFKDAFGVQDPVIGAQEANTSATGQNTTALNQLTTALNAKSATPGFGGLTGAPQVDAGMGGLQNFMTGIDPNFKLDMSGLQQDVTNFSTSMGNVTTNLAAWNGSLPQVYQTSTEFANVGNYFNTSLQGAGAAIANTPSTFGSLQNGIGSFVGILGMAGMAVAGIAQMGKGGTYNTLMGLSGIFGALGGIFGMFGGRGFGGFFAKGGPVSARTPYIVGEEGPELFVPQANGEILSNGATEDVFQQSRNSLSAQRKVVMDKAAMAQQNVSMSPIDVRYESQVINQVEYVTAEQHRKGMDQAARRGQLLAYQGMQNSLKVRRRIGI